MSVPTVDVAEQVVYLDTAGLWCLDAMLTPTTIRDPRWPEYLAHLCDVLSDPNRRVRCLVPSAERLGGPLPSFYNALLSADLMDRADSLRPDDLSTPESELDAQWREFLRHTRANARLTRAWYNLHNHQDIRDGWRLGVPDQSARWEGVPRWLEDFLRTRHPQDLMEVQNRLGWRAQHTALTFSFVQRAYPYSVQAAARGAEYFTHPARWQVLRNPNPARPTPHFGLALGGVIVGSIKSRALKRDADKVAEFIVEIRDRLTKKYRPSFSSAEEATEFLHGLLPGAIGARPNKQLDQYVKVTAELLIALAVVVATGSWPSGLMSWFISRVVVQPRDTTVSRSESRLFRRWIDYQQALALSVRTCPYDGAELAPLGCPTCALRSMEESEPRGGA